MIIILFSLFPLLITYTFYISSHRFHILDNSVDSFNYSLPKRWIVLDTTEPLHQPMFDTKLVEETSISHFKNNLKNHLEKITLGFYYFSEETLLESKERYISGVRVSITCNLPFQKDYYKAFSYVVSKTI